MTQINWVILQNKLHESRVPLNLHDGLIAYIINGRRTGQFLRAVLENDLAEACARADEECKYRLFDIVFFLYNYAPLGCWRSPASVAYWMINGGYLGVHEANLANSAKRNPNREEDGRIIP